MSQLGFFDGDPRLKAFLEFHEANPHVYDWLRARSFDLLARGHTHYSARTLLHAFRFHTSMETGGDEYKINNNWSPFYARLLMENEPDLDGFFELRAAVADEA